MSSEELRHELSKKDTEIATLMRIIEMKEREFLNKEQAIRQENCLSVHAARDMERKFSADNEKRLENYHQQKV
jgi:hypothetical protein